jgi:tetratricopeptide (TPR) repeat protein
LLESALGLVWEVGCRPVETRIRQQQGNLHLMEGDLERAEVHFSLALDEARLGRDQPAEADALIGIAQVQQREGLGEQAARTVELAYGITQRCGDRALSGRCSVILADVYCDTGRTTEAQSLVQQALSLLSQVSDLAWQSRALAVLTRIRERLNSLSTDNRA